MKKPNNQQIKEKVNKKEGQKKNATH